MTRAATTARGSHASQAAKPARGTALVVACALLTCTGCSKDEKPAEVNLSSRFARQPFPVAAPTVPDATIDDPPWPSADNAAALPTSGGSGAPRGARVALAADSGSSGVNADLAILERTRMAAGGCFTSLPAGPGFGPPERSAHIVLTIVSTGTVTRADVSSGDTDDGAVLDCVHDRAAETRFSDTNGGPLRTYAIDVRVFAPGSAGAH